MEYSCPECCAIVTHTWIKVGEDQSISKYGYCGKCNFIWRIQKIEAPKKKNKIITWIKDYLRGER